MGESSLKSVHFFLGPWVLVCQFVEISNQMELTCEVSNLEYKKLYNALVLGVPPKLSVGFCQN